MRIVHGDTEYDRTLDETGDKVDSLAEKANDLSTASAALATLAVAAAGVGIFRAAADSIFPAVEFVVATASTFWAVKLGQLSAARSRRSAAIEAVLAADGLRAAQYVDSSSQERQD